MQNTKNHGWTGDFSNKQYYDYIYDQNKNLITSIVIPEKVTTIQMNFAQYDNLETIIVPGKNDANDFEHLSGGTDTVFGNKEVIYLGSDESIATNLFTYEDEEKTIINGVKYKESGYIGSWNDPENKVYYEYLKDAYGNLVNEIVIPAKVTSINLSFAEFDNLTKITILGKDSVADFTSLTGGEATVFGEIEVVYEGK